MHCHDGTWPLLEHILREVVRSGLGIQTLVLRCLPTCVNWSAIDQITPDTHSLRTIHIECHTLPSRFASLRSRSGPLPAADIEDHIKRMKSSLPTLYDHGRLQIHRLNSSYDCYSYDSRYPPTLYCTANGQFTRCHRYWEEEIITQTH